jgi:hypothetical protein
LHPERYLFLQKKWYRKNRKEIYAGRKQLLKLSKRM